MTCLICHDIGWLIDSGETHPGVIWRRTGHTVRDDADAHDCMRRHLIAHGRLDLWDRLTRRAA